MTQQERQKYSFDIRVGTTNLDEPVTSIDHVIIAYDLDTAIDYCKSEYDMQGMDEVVSDELSVVYEKSYLGQMSDHGNIHEVTNETLLENRILDENSEIKEEFEGEYGYFRDVVDINGGEITEKDYQYMKSGQYWNSVIDLTEKSN